MLATYFIGAPPSCSIQTYVMRDGTPGELVLPPLRRRLERQGRQPERTTPWVAPPFVATDLSTEAITDALRRSEPYAALREHLVDDRRLMHMVDSGLGFAPRRAQPPEGDDGR